LPWVAPIHEPATCLSPLPSLPPRPPIGIPIEFGRIPFDVKVFFVVVGYYRILFANDF
jgi:hypothetical protein